LDYSLGYSYRRFRPQFFIESMGENYYQDYAKTELRRDYEHWAGVQYPLDRYHRLEVAAATRLAEERYEKFPQFNYHEKENLWSLAFFRDTITGRYLQVTGGDRFRVAYQVARPVLGGDREYRSHFFEYHRFTPTGRESVVAFRGLGGVSLGESPQLVRLGGVDRLRGYSRMGGENQAARFVITNVEWRVPLRFTNCSTFLIFPDFSLKALSATLFTDTGYAWERSSDLESVKIGQLRNSVGAGIQLPLFVLQTYAISLSMDVAKRTDARNWVWYFSLGPAF
jgi:hypothetical protein